MKYFLPSLIILLLSSSCIAEPNFELAPKSDINLDSVETNQFSRLTLSELIERLGQNPLEQEETPIELKKDGLEAYLKAFLSSSAKRECPSPGLAGSEIHCREKYIEFGVSINRASNSCLSYEDVVEAMDGDLYLKHPEKKDGYYKGLDNPDLEENEVILPDPRRFQPPQYSYFVSQSKKATLLVFPAMSNLGQCVDQVWITQAISNSER